MTTDALKELLIWASVIHYGVLLLWFGLFVFAHDWIYGLHTRWFKLSKEAFDALNYGAVAIYKIGVLLLYVVPLVVLLLVT